MVLKIEICHLGRPGNEAVTFVIFSGLEKFRTLLLRRLVPEGNISLFSFAALFKFLLELLFALPDDPNSMHSSSESTNHAEQSFRSYLNFEASFVVFFLCFGM